MSLPDHTKDHATPVNGSGVEDLIRDVHIAVIGGTGLYSLDGLKVLGEINPETVRGTIRAEREPH